MPDDTNNEPLSSHEKVILQTVAQKRVREAVNTTLKTFQLNPTQWMILGVLHDNTGPQKISAIAVSLQVEVPLITTLAQGLVRQGLIVQSQNDSDRRSKPIALTTAGSDLLIEIEALLAKDLAQLEVGISAPDMEQYVSTLRTIISNGEQLDSRRPKR